MQLPTIVAPTVPCSRCEQLPPQVPDGGHLYLWFPLGHTLGKAFGALSTAGIAHQRLDDRQSVRVIVGAGNCSR